MSFAAASGGSRTWLWRFQAIETEGRIFVPCFWFLLNEKFSILGFWNLFLICNPPKATISRLLGKKEIETTSFLSILFVFSQRRTPVKAKFAEYWVVTQFWWGSKAQSCQLKETTNYKNGVAHLKNRFSQHAITLIMTEPFSLVHKTVLGHFVKTK